MKLTTARLLQIGVDALVVCIAFVVAYGIRFEGQPPREYIKQLILVAPYLVLLRLSLFAAFSVYRLVWRYISLRDLPRLVASTLAGSALLAFARFWVEPASNLVGLRVNPAFATVPYGVLVAEWVMTTVGLIAVRGIWRLIVERSKRTGPRQAVYPSAKKRALLIGAGSAGVMVAREVRSRPDVGFEVLGFLDDEKRKQGTIIHGFKVLGSTERLAEFAQELGAELAVITMASVPAASIRRIVAQAEAANLKVQITPGLYEILAGRVNISKIRDVAIEDLLGRAPVELETDRISEYLTGKVVLVTGAGGSIGSEICRQVASFGPRLLVMVEQAENPLFHIHNELQRTFADLAMAPVIANIVDRERMKQIMTLHRPEVVFHAAAHKHVPLMEANPSEAVRNNVTGTRAVADLAHQLGAEAFVMISTDKAVNPTSVMGATKRLAEMYVQSLSAVSETRFITVRFGNVLGSQGSVVPLFKEQIARGGPVTITHPEMRRYFMTIPEASQLVLQAGAMGDGGEIYILEMGEPILIVNLARDLIRLSGYRPDDDIRIVFSGIRPGEKLYEEINLSEENAAKTKHPRIWTGRSQIGDVDQLRGAIDAFGPLLQGSPEAVRELLAAQVPEYQRTAMAGAERNPGDEPRAPAARPQSAQLDLRGLGTAAGDRAPATTGDRAPAGARAQAVTLGALPVAAAAAVRAKASSGQLAEIAES
ncbi:MAG: polysaccharide biosynthesis protein [Deltaproteobacteria bacterium]|nr:polysaccharide biosynthesis protein [Deltaproteobacteria bacterium]